MRFGESATLSTSPRARALALSPSLSLSFTLSPSFPGVASPGAFITLSYLSLSFTRPRRLGTYTEGGDLVK